MPKDYRCFLTAARVGSTVAIRQLHSSSCPVPVTCAIAISRQLLTPSAWNAAMLETALYVFTAFVTAAQVYWLLAWGIWGAPTSPLQYISICGSFALFVAGVLAKWRPRVTAFTALAASIAMWCFYAPALIHTLHSLPTSMTLQSSLVALTPVVLLVLSTASATKDIAKRYRAA